MDTLDCRRRLCRNTERRLALGSQFQVRIGLLECHEMNGTPPLLGQWGRANFPIEIVTCPAPDSRGRERRRERSGGNSGLACGRGVIRWH
jgi:hypothetical protein